MYNIVRGKVDNRAAKVAMVMSGFMCPPVIGAVANMNNGRAMRFVMADMMVGSKGPIEV